jgi:CTP synthase
MKKKNHKYIFVIGGVMSGVGKGIATSSIARLLMSRGFEVNPIKVDPYLNVDAGTMNPTEHGEAFVLDSGLETDQDMGNYERFLNKSLRSENYMTSGMVYQSVLNRERNLGYGGRCVEAVPHVRDEIVDRIQASADVNGSTISVIEVGGTVGDFQNALFIDAARVLKLKHPHDVVFVMVTYLPIPNKIGEMKTKPTQSAVRALNSYGVQPDFIIARSEVPLDKKRKEKIGISCSVQPDHVISAPDIESIYEVPLNFEKDKLAEELMELLQIKGKKNPREIKAWQNFVTKLKHSRDEVHIAIVGKYFDTGDFVLSDAYISVIEAIKFSAYSLGKKPVLTWINAKHYEGKSGGERVKELSKYDGVIVPGGFGESGIEGKIMAISYARKNKIPYFGLCYGMQLMVVEYARNVLGLKEANTTEINKKSKYPVIDIMPEQKKLLAEKQYGASMRLGAYPAILKSNTIARHAYGKSEIQERHRHRYEVNPEYVAKIEDAGLVFSGRSPDGRLMEIAELPIDVHPFFLGTQFHPEFLARPLSPHPLFNAFMKAAIERKKT